MHLLKQTDEIEVIEDGISTSNNDEQPLNADSPINVIDVGKFISTSDVQFRKALFSIIVTDDGIITCFNDEQSMNASVLIVVTVDGMFISTNFLHF